MEQAPQAGGPLNRVFSMAGEAAPAAKEKNHEKGIKKNTMKTDKVLICFYLNHLPLDCLGGIP